MTPKYDLEKIKFATDSPTFDKAIDLYDKERVTQFKNLNDGYSAVVLGGNPYQVFVSSRDFDVGSCTCYFGINDTLCKHMVTVAIFAVKDGKSLTIEDRGTRRDFVDTYFLSKKYTLEEILGFYQKKYAVLEDHLYAILRALDYFEDAKQEQQMPQMLTTVS
jgi:uncharacterized Zn finger protein